MRYERRYVLSAVKGIPAADWLQKNKSSQKVDLLRAFIFFLFYHISPAFTSLNIEIYIKEKAFLLPSFKSATYVKRSTY